MHLWYDIKGSGFPIVFLHGFLEDHWMWEKIVSGLMKEYQCIRIDLPGHGNSKHVPVPWSIEDIGILVQRTLDALAVRRPIIVGHSMGGYVGLTMLQLSEGLILMQSRAEADSQETKFNRDRAIEAIQHNKERYVSGMINGLFNPKRKSKYAHVIQMLIERANNMKEEAIVGSIIAMKLRKDSTELLNNKVAFIAGKQDPVIPIDDLKRAMKRVGETNCVVLSPCGHMSHIEAPKATLFAIRKLAEKIIDESQTVYF